MIITTSWDDGHPLDFRVAEMLARYNLPGTFYIPLSNAEHILMPRANIQRLASAGFEIGCHTWSHVRLPGLSQLEQQHEIVEAKAEMESFLGQAVTAFCYPGGKFDKTVQQVVKEAGFRGARGTARFHVAPASNLWLWHTSNQAHCFSRFEIGKHLLIRWNPAGWRWWMTQSCDSSWVELSIRLLDWAERADGIWHLWGHSWEVEAEDQWAALEIVLSAAARRSRSLRMTNGELFAHAYSHSS